MKKLNKRLLGSVFALVIALALATTSTFAWFTMNTTPTVEGFNLNVTAQDGIYISVSKVGETNADYKASISEEEILAVIGENVVLDAVTSENGTTFSKLNSGTATANTDYAEFQLNFYSTSQYNVKLNSATVTSSKEKTAPVALEDIAGTTIKKGDSLATAAANAARISFAGTTTKIYEPNSAAGFGAASYNNVNVADEFYKQVLGKYSTGTDSAALEISGASDALTATLLGLTANQNQTGFVGSIVVRVYIEGSDADCLTSILGASLNTTMIFGATLAA